MPDGRVDAVARLTTANAGAIVVRGSYERILCHERRLDAEGMVRRARRTGNETRGSAWTSRWGSVTGGRRGCIASGDEAARRGACARRIASRFTMHALNILCIARISVTVEPTETVTTRGSLGQARQAGNESMRTTVDAGPGSSARSKPDGCAPWERRRGLTRQRCGEGNDTAPATPSGARYRQEEPGGPVADEERVWSHCSRLTISRHSSSPRTG